MSTLIERRCFLQLMAVGALAACSRKARRAAIARGSTVLALGDSLTYGYGAAPESAYPVVLSQLSAWNVVNGGISGDTSGEALSRLPELLEDSAPKLVIVSIGGNDFLRKKPESETRANIGKIIETIQAKNIPLILVGVPSLSLAAALGRPNDNPLYADLAKQYRVPLLSKAWSDVLGNEKLRSDQVHANAAGYRVFAEKVNDFVRQEGFL